MLPWPLPADLGISRDVFACRSCLIGFAVCLLLKTRNFKSQVHFCVTWNIRSAVSSSDRWSQASSQNKHAHTTAREQERSTARNLARNLLPLIYFPHCFFWLSSWMWPWDYPAGSSECASILLTHTWLPLSYSHDSWLGEVYFCITHSLVAPVSAKGLAL